MENNFLFKLHEFLVKNLVSLTFLPLLTFFIILITYGTAINQYLIENHEMYNLYELATLKAAISGSAVPAHVHSIAHVMAIYCYSLFSIWLISFLYSSYKKLSQRKHDFQSIILEIIILAIIFCFIVSPGLYIYIQLAGWLFILLTTIVVFIYWLLFNQMKYEKE